MLGLLSLVGWSPRPEMAAAFPDTPTMWAVARWLREADPRYNTAPTTTVVTVPADLALQTASGQVAAFPATQTVFSVAHWMQAAHPWCNTAPTAAVEVEHPDPFGVVRGVVIGEDPQGDPLTYTISDAPTYGSVSLDTASGKFIYTPTTTDRAVSADSFTVRVEDGHLKGTTTVVARVDVKPVTSPTSVVVGHSTLQIPCGPDGVTVPADWYFPTGP